MRHVCMTTLFSLWRISLLADPMRWKHGNRFNALSLLHLITPVLQHKGQILCCNSLTEYCQLQDPKTRFKRQFLGQAVTFAWPSVDPHQTASAAIICHQGRFQRLRHEMASHGSQREQDHKLLAKGVRENWFGFTDSIFISFLRFGRTSKDWSRSYNMCERQATSPLSNRWRGKVGKAAGCIRLLEVHGSLDFLNNACQTKHIYPNDLDWSLKVTLYQTNTACVILAWCLLRTR